MPQEWGDLGGADCHAVVVGTGRQGAAGDGARLADLPGATRSARELARLLRERAGMAGRVTEVIDPQSPTEVLTALRTAVDRAQGGAVLFCFVGHGLLGPRRQLYLATSSTTTPDDTVTAVPYAEVRNLLAEAPARTVVVLDCCFSGRAEAAPSAAHRDPYASARPAGSFLLASATHYAASFAPVGQEHTLFAGELIRLLAEGDPSGPKWLTLIDLYRILDRRFQGGPARPYADGVGRAGDLVVARNAGYPAAAPAGPDDAAAREAPSGGPCPYPGMRPFLPEQSHLFFGREELAAALRERVEHGQGPVVLVGASGAGKSSLLRAGLVAGLEERGTGSVLLVPGPGGRPFRTLVEHWARAVDRPFAEVERELGAGRFGGEGPAVLVVDQLEELFTDCDDVEERELFLRALSSAAPATAPRIVLGLRADFYALCLRDPRLARIVQAGQFTVPSMSDTELRAAIERPAEHAGLRLEDGLADHLLHELRQETTGDGEAVALPFLAHALQQTWARRRGALLTFTGYESSGGIRRSVARVADEVHDALDAAGRARLRALLLRMVTLVDADGRAVRRRVPVPETAGDADRELLDRLADARLVVLDRGEAQLCHDSLLYGWPRLRDWIRADRVRLLVRRRAGDAADSWDEAGRPNSGLYRGDQLATARSLLNEPAAGDPAAPTAPLRPVERDFLRASDRAELLARRIRTTVVAVVAVLAVLAGTLAVVARDAQRDAEARETVAVANQLAAQADTMRGRDPQTALRLSLAAYRTAETSETRSSLYASYMSRPQVDLRGDLRQPVVNLAYGAGGKVLAVSRRTGRIRLWDVSLPNAPVRGAEFRLNGTAPIAFHPRTPLLAAIGKDALTLYDVTDAARPRKVAEQRLAAAQSYSLAFSPDGRTLAAGGENGRLRLWDVSTPSVPRSLLDRVVAPTHLMAVAFNRDGRFLATGNGVSEDAAGRDRPAQVRLWDVRDPARTTLLTTATAASVMALAFHPKRDLLVATGGEGAMAWWTVAQQGRRLARVVAKDDFQNKWGYGSSLPSLDFRPDGGLLVAAQAADPGGAMVRAVGDDDSPDQLLSSLAEHDTLPSGEPAQAVAYSPDGAYVATGDVGGNVRLWPDHAPALTLPGTPTRGTPGTRPHSADGRFVLTDESDVGSFMDGVVRVWDMSTADTRGRKAPALRFTLPRPWEARFFLPGRDRPMLLAHRWTEATDDHAFRVWDLGGDGPPVPGAEMHVRAPDIRTAVSPDGELLVIGSSTEPTAAVWDIRDPRRPVRRAVITVTPSIEEESLFFMGPRGLATVEGDGRSRGLDLRLWDLTDPEHPFRVPDPLRDAALNRAVYVPSLRMLLVDGTDQNARLWDMADIRHPKSAGRLPAAPGGYHPVGGNLIATMLQDGTVQLFDVRKPKTPVRTMRFDREITEVQRAPDGSRILTGSPYRIWDVAPDGSWRMPAVATLDGVKSITLLPGPTPYVLAVPEESGLDGPQLTHLLDRDTDKVYERLCATHPLGVERDQWKALFPHLGYRASC
ncbi:caspase family protein [Streptomyces sp. NPDC051921]|uniref:caspase, EACC1-associated type n=1 Tax=Streptomyces sp. NPDC051921 TaxID=3155806 RepID=UPI00343220FD